MKYFFYSYKQCVDSKSSYKCSENTEKLKIFEKNTCFSCYKQYGFVYLHR